MTALGVKVAAARAAGALSRRTGRGGTSLPGKLLMRLEPHAIARLAARLPRVGIERPHKVIGDSTVSAIQSGLYYGYAGLVDGILRRIFAERPPSVVELGAREAARLREIGPRR